MSTNCLPVPANEPITVSMTDALNSGAPSAGAAVWMAVAAQRMAATT
ncbi:hypothetical protein [Agromyces bauzanensis]|nr:hypothetical protein [Agromyces bauzanensis]